MADFQLEVDIGASTGKLEKGVQKSQRELDKLSQSANKAGAAQDSFTDKAAKTLAKVGALEAGVKALGIGIDGTKAIFAAATGDAEMYDAAVDSLANTALSLPFGLGAVAGAIEMVAKSILGVAEAEAEAAAAFEKLAEMEKIAASAIKFREALDGINRSLEDQIEILKERDPFERARIEIDQQTEKQLEELEARIRTFREETGRDPGKAMLEAIEKQREQIEEIARLKKQEIDLEEEATKEAERQEKIAKRKKELDEAAAKHQKEMIALEKERVAEEKKREAEAEKRRKKEEEQQKKALAMAKAKAKMEKELLQAREDAELAVAGATATFSTAGGSFTTGVSAQVNEQKLLTKISEQSRDFLSQIVRNTAALRAGGFA